VALIDARLLGWMEEKEKGEGVVRVYVMVERLKVVWVMMMCRLKKLEANTV
jgi:hypothetical protein